VATVLDGTQSWKLASEQTGFVDQFDRACKILKSYAQDGKRLNQLVEKTGLAFHQTASRYFDSLPFTTLGDLIGAVETIFRAPENFFGSNFSEFLAYIPMERRSLEAVTEILEMIREDALEQQLQRVWREPTVFDLTPEFITTLGDRVMAFSLPATEYKPPIDAYTIAAAVSELKQDFEAAKWDSDYAVERAATFAAAKGTAFSKNDAKEVRKNVKRGIWTSEIREIYEIQAVEIRSRVEHLVRYSNLAGWPELVCPDFAGVR